MFLIFKRLLHISFSAVLFFVVFFASCSNSKPEIVYGFLQLVLYQGEDGGAPREQFSFFIMPDDDDGLENLDELYLFHDKEQLRWQIKSDEWISYNHDGQDWIGTRSISVREGSIPRGMYRAVLVNKGGESTERTFTFDGIVRFPFPEIEITDGIYAVTSQWPVNRLVCYDRQGNYAATVTLQSMTGSILQLNLPSSARTVSLWAEDEGNFCSAYTGVVPVN